MSAAKQASSLVAASASMAKEIASAEIKKAHAEHVVPAVEKAKNVVTENVESTAKNPLLIGGLAAVGAGVAIAAAPAVFSAAILPVLGFGAGGVQAGTIAAGVQSLIGNVAGGSLFAAAQSAGAGGAGAVVVNGIVQGVGVAVAAVGGALAGCGTSGSEENDSKENEASDVPASVDSSSPQRD